MPVADPSVNSPNCSMFLRLCMCFVSLLLVSWRVGPVVGVFFVCVLSSSAAVCALYFSPARVWSPVLPLGDGMYGTVM